MPRTPLPVLRATLAGTTVVFNPATANDEIVPKGARTLLVQNTSGATITVTIPSNLVLDGLTVPDRTISVPAAAIVAIALGSYPGEGVQSDGAVYVNYSTVTGVNVAYLESY